MARFYSWQPYIQNFWCWNSIAKPEQDLQQGVLLGDSGYPCRPFLLSPYRQPEDRKELRLNRSNFSTRSTIEKTFGIWKKRFNVLHSEIRMKPAKVCKVIIACAVLLNIAIMRKEPLDEQDEQEDAQPQMPRFDGQQDGRGIRDHFANTFFP